jgi:hypothetical protein
MPIKPRSYFYPVLSPISSDYESDVIFNIEMEPRIVDGAARNQIAIVYEVFLNSAPLRDFIIDKRAALALDFYCGDTMYRELFKVSELKGEIQLPIATIKGKLEIQPFIIVIDDSYSFTLEKISPEYNSHSFDLEMGAPLAIAPSVTIPVDFALSSIKEMVKIRLEAERDKNSYAIGLTADQIVVFMGSNAHAAWTAMSSDASQKPTLFFSVYKDCIAAVLEALVRNTSEVEFSWMEHFKDELEKRNLKLPSKDATFTEINELSLKILGPRGYEKVVANAV